MSPIEDRYLTEDPDFLEFCYRELWSAAGASDEHAEVMARCVSHGDRIGKSLQGLGVFELPVLMLRSGNLDIEAVPEVVDEGPAWLVVDGHRSSGQWTLTTGVDRAIQKARETGIALVMARNLNDCGCFSVFTMQAMREGMVAIASNNSPPLTSPWGGMRNTMSAAPLSLSAPGGVEHLPIVVDLQLIDAHDGTIADAYLHGERLSGPYLIDPDTGETTDDPTDFYLPIADFARLSDMRGATVFSTPRIYALNVLAEVLTSFIVPGGVITPEIPHPLSVWAEQQPTTSVGGAFAIVIDPSHFVAGDEYRGKVDRFADAVKSAPRRPGVDEIALPGERGLRAMEAGGPVQIVRAHWESFERIVADFDFTVDELRRRFAEQR